MPRRNSGGLTWYYDTLTPNMRLFAVKFQAYLAVEMEKWAAIAEETAQRDASWQDRTGSARAGLTAEGHTRGFYHFIELFHTVDYGIWLEIRWNGKYAVIEPTLRKIGPAMMAHLSIEGGIDGPRAA